MHTEHNTIWQSANSRHDTTNDWNNKHLMTRKSKAVSWTVRRLYITSNVRCQFTLSSNSSGGAAVSCRLPSRLPLIGWTVVSRLHTNKKTQM